MFNTLMLSMAAILKSNRLSQDQRSNWVPLLAKNESQCTDLIFFMQVGYNVGDVRDVVRNQKSGVPNRF